MAVVMNSDVGSQMFASPLKFKYRGLYDLPFFIHVRGERDNRTENITS